MNDVKKKTNNIFALGVLCAGLSIIGVLVSTQPLTGLIFFSLSCIIWIIILHSTKLYIEESKKHT